MTKVFEINHITKDYGNQKGVFDVSFSVNQGEVMGFLGPNGAGKTTTIRQLMGFIHPDSGEVKINGLDCFKDAAKIQETLGYLPGEIAFMDGMTGIEFIKFIADMKNMTDLSYAKELMEFFELDPKGKLKKMSKGMKQKIGIVCAFMNHPKQVILDEPTSGLDPLMQNRFVELILKEKAKGTTILMSSHIFEEIERTCDRTVIIKSGHIMAVEDMNKLKSGKKKNYIVRFKDKDSAEQYAKEHQISKEAVEDATITVGVKGNVDDFIKGISKYEIKDLSIKSQSLEEMFMHFYGGEENVK
ncbi:MAG: ABC transporter ATP-binding protein [Clostridiales bacterium]|nr:ABC transporter ATP-binding protein [Clostridiales bacterium]